MARFRVRLEGVGVAGPDAELIVRRLLCEPHTDLTRGANVWLEFRALTDGQIEGYVGLLRSRGVHTRYLEILDDQPLRARLLERPLSALVADVEDRVMAAVESEDGP